ncbi:YcnI family protein [Streptomyces sp. NPDC051940]|uniref:YcnI family copper-binding membrane protein n=1 Tax=Streptomyces sp. NPDC051940 TaxID=3155675 RepID=UPI00342605C7
MRLHLSRGRAALTAGLAAGGVLLLAPPALAHVSVSPEGTAQQGGYATVNFKVPNERDDSSTIKLEVTLPADHPLSSAMPQPVPGWDVKVEKAKLAKPLEVHGNKITEAPSRITWSGGKIEPGTFQQFPVSLGALPEDTDELVFKAVQTYDDNEVVRWIEVQQEGAEEPENPAPVLALSPAEGDGHHGGTTGSPAAATGSDAKSDAGHDDTAAASSGGDGSDTLARTLGVAGIVIGAAGLAFGILSRRKSA